MKDTFQKDSDKEAGDRVRGIMEETIEVADDLVSKFGLPTPTPPPFTLEFPSDMSALHSEELSAQLTYWNSMRSRASFLVSLHEGAKVVENTEAEHRFNVMYASSDMKHVTDKRHNTGSLRQVRNRQAAVALIDRELGILRSLLQSYENNYSAISREIARRS